VSRPRIAVSGFTRAVDGIERTGVNLGYVARVLEAGGLPLVLSPELGPQGAVEALQACDGLLLTGGADIAPARYGASPSPSLGQVDEARDAAELALYASARASQLPILAICRGLQVVNVAHGGTLWQDLPSERPGPVTHVQTGPRHERTHGVRLEPGTRTSDVLGAVAVRTNSMHHQAVRELGAGLRASGWAEDGVIEAMEGTDGGWLVAVQWHPEEHRPEPPDEALFRAFVREATPRS